MRLCSNPCRWRTKRSLRFEWVPQARLTFSLADYTGDGNTDMRISWDGGAIVLGGVTASEVSDLIALKSYMMFDA